MDSQDSSGQWRCRRDFCTPNKPSDDETKSQLSNAADHSQTFPSFSPRPSLSTKTCLSSGSDLLKIVKPRSLAPPQLRVSCSRLSPPGDFESRTPGLLPHAARSRWGASSPRFHMRAQANRSTERREIPTPSQATGVTLRPRVFARFRHRARLAKPLGTAMAK
jgi:hypothetical protein